MGKAVVDETGRVLLRRGVELTSAYINALKNAGYSSVYVTDPENDIGVPIDEDLDPVTRARATTALREAFEEIGRELESLRSKSMNDAIAALDSDEVRALTSRRGPLSKINALVPSILDEVLDRATVAGLTSIKNESSALYDHSIDVCVIAVMIGKVLNLNNARMRQLANGCLLHDIAKVFMDPGLDRETEIRQHAKLGFELLRHAEESEMLAPYVAYEHHEHQDGSGLPRGLIGSNTIDRKRDAPGPVPTLIGEIAAIANTYDNLLSGTGYTQVYTPDQALEHMAEISGTILNKEIVKAFRKVVPIYPQGCQVMLLGAPFSGHLGTVCEIRAEKLDRPDVIITKDSKGNAVDHKRVNMLDYPEVRLRCVNF